MKILAFESSCDETAVAVVEDGRRGVVRCHCLSGGPPRPIRRRGTGTCLPQARGGDRRPDGPGAADANWTRKDIDAVAVTYAPGLIGAVLVGLSFAKSVAFALGVPLIPVHHIRGHIAANYLAFPELEPPFLALAISGRKYPDRGCAGLHGSPHSGCHPGRRSRGVL